MQKKRFCEDTGIDFFGEDFLGFLRGVIEREIHCRIVSFYEGFLIVFPSEFEMVVDEINGKQTTINSSAR